MKLKQVRVWYYAQTSISHSAVKIYPYAGARCTLYAVRCICMHVILASVFIHLGGYLTVRNFLNHDLTQIRFLICFLAIWCIFQEY